MTVLKQLWFNHAWKQIHHTHMHKSTHKHTTYDRYMCVCVRESVYCWRKRDCLFVFYAVPAKAISRRCREEESEKEVKEIFAMTINAVMWSIAYILFPSCKTCIRIIFLWATLFYFQIENLRDIEANCRRPRQSSVCWRIMQPRMQPSLKKGYFLLPR